MNQEIEKLLSDIAEFLQGFPNACHIHTSAELRERIAEILQNDLNNDEKTN